MGLQPDEQPDSLGMIVVTEELSRGSLGAAGSLITRPEIAARALLAGALSHRNPAGFRNWLRVKSCVQSRSPSQTPDPMLLLSLCVPRQQRADGC